MLALLRQRRCYAATLMILIAAISFATRRYDAIYVFA